MEASYKEDTKHPGKESDKDNNLSWGSRVVDFCFIFDFDLGVQLDK